jgi:hypothetical protein
MRISLTGGYVAAFACLVLLHVELHEQAQALTTRVLCGGWPERTFDNVLAYAGCGDAALPLIDLAGPLFSLIWMGAGAWLLLSRNPAARAWGFSLLFSGLPVGRVLPQIVAMWAPGATSDESAFFRRLPVLRLDQTDSALLAFVVTVAAVAPLLVVAWRRLEPDGRARTFAAFGFLPLALVTVWVMTAMNGLLRIDPLPGLGWTGWPGLIVLHTAVVAVLFVVLRGHIAALTTSRPREGRGRSGD